MASRGEFYTAYTPYQAEASQGTLQATFEYQTLITQLTGMDVSNASLYDGGSAVSRGGADGLGGHPSVRPRRRRRLGSSRVPPDPGDHLDHLEPELVTVPAPHGQVEPATFEAVLTDDTAAVVLQYPNFFGQLEDVEALVKAIHPRGARGDRQRRSDQPGSAARRPTTYGADIVVAEGQGLGNPMSFGGPYLGIMACREEYLRKMPGRIVGQTTDRNGKRCWVLTLQTREQHIRREKATSNICTNQGLLALRGSIYLAAMGPRGLRQAAELIASQGPLRGRGGWRRFRVLSLPFPGPFFKEFVVRCAEGSADGARRSRPPAITAASPGPLVSRPGRLHPGRRYREAHRDEIDGLAAAYDRALSKLKTG